MTHPLSEELRKLASKGFWTEDSLKEIEDALRRAADALDELQKEVEYPGASAAFRYFKSETARLEAEKERDELRRQLDNANGATELVTTALKRAEAQAANLCTLVRRLLVSKHLKHEPDVVKVARDYLTQIDGWGAALRADRLEKLERVAEAARTHVKKGGMQNAQTLADTLAALDAEGDGT